MNSTLLLLLVIGILFMFSGLSDDYKKKCDDDIDIKFVPRNVYDEILKNQVINNNI